MTIYYIQGISEVTSEDQTNIWKERVLLNGFSEAQSYYKKCGSSAAVGGWYGCIR